MDLKRTLAGLFFITALLAKINTSSRHIHTCRISNSTSLRCHTCTPVSLFHILSNLNSSPQNGGHIKDRYLLYSSPRWNIFNNRSTAYSLTRLSVSMVLLLSGDIQLNPGPRMARFPCGLCGKNVNSNHKAMECEDCEVWYHTRCVGMKDILYQVHKQHNSYSWICCQCGLRNFSSSMFDIADVDTSNSFEPLFNLLDVNYGNEESFNPNSTEQLGSPLHSSSPKNRKRGQSPKRLNKKSSKKKPTGNILKILNINFQSIRNKVTQFQALMETEKPDIVIGTETWLQDSTYSSELLPSSYQIFRHDRPSDTTGGGVLIALRSDLVAMVEDLHPTHSSEMLWTSLHVKGRPMLYIGAFYRKHHGSVTLDQKQLADLEAAVSKLPTNSQQQSRTSSQNNTCSDRLSRSAWKATTAPYMAQPAKPLLLPPSKGRSPIAMYRTGM